MKSIYEEAGGTYTRQGDYELPDLKIPPEREVKIGVWGQRHRQYLKQHHRIRYYNLLTAGKLNEHLAEIDHQAELKNYKTAYDILRFLIFCFMGRS